MFLGNGGFRVQGSGMFLGNREGLGFRVLGCP